MLGDLDGRLVEGNDGIVIDLGAEHVEVIDDEPIRTVLARAAVANQQLSLAFHSHSTVTGWADERLSSLRHAGP